MATIDLIGVPIPIELPEFKNDAKLLKKIRQLESLIEINHDIEDAEEALKALWNSLKNENQQRQHMRVEYCFISIQLKHRTGINRVRTIYY